VKYDFKFHSKHFVYNKMKTDQIQDIYIYKEMLCFVDRASHYKLLLIINLMHFFTYSFIHFTSVHVSTSSAHHQEVELH
jgi:hypothetical protein